MARFILPFFLLVAFTCCFVSPLLGKCVTVFRHDFPEPTSACDPILLDKSVMGSNEITSVGNETIWFELKNQALKPTLALFSVNASTAFNQMDLSIYTAHGQEFGSYFPVTGSNNQIGLLDSRYLWIQIPYNLSVYIPIFPLLRDPSPPLGDVTYTFILNPLGVSDVNLEDSHEISLEPGQYQWMSIGALEVSTPEKLQYFIIQFEGDCELELYAKGQSSMLYPKFPSPLDRVYPHPFTFAGSDREFHDSYVYSREVGQSSEQVVFGFRNPDDKTCSATVDAYLAELPKDEVKFDVDTSLKVKKHRFSLMKFSSSYLASDNVGKTATMTVDKLKVELVPLDMYVGWGIPPVESNIHKVFYGNSDFVFQLEKPIPWMVVGVVPAASGNIMLSAYLGEISFWNSPGAIILYIGLGTLLTTALVALGVFLFKRRHSSYTAL